jgi:hypothetical protein
MTGFRLGILAAFRIGSATWPGATTWTIFMAKAFLSFVATQGVMAAKRGLHWLFVSGPL